MEHKGELLQTFKKSFRGGEGQKGDFSFRGKNLEGRPNRDRESKDSQKEDVRSEKKKGGSKVGSSPMGGTRGGVVVGRGQLSWAGEEGGESGLKDVGSDQRRPERGRSRVWKMAFYARRRGCRGKWLPGGGLLYGQEKEKKSMDAGDRREVLVDAGERKFSF